VFDDDAGRAAAFGRAGGRPPWKRCDECKTSTDSELIPPLKLDNDRVVAKAKEIGADGILMLTNEEGRRMISDGIRHFSSF